MVRTTWESAWDSEPVMLHRSRNFIGTCGMPPVLNRSTFAQRRAYGCVCFAVRAEVLLPSLELPKSRYPLPLTLLRTIDARTVTIVVLSRTKVGRISSLPVRFVVDVEIFKVGPCATSRCPSDGQLQVIHETEGQDNTSLTSMRKHTDQF